MAAALTRRRGRAGAGRAALGRGRVVVRCRPSLGGGFWYLRNLSSPATRCPRSPTWGRSPCLIPSGCRRARPDFSIVHYATDTGVWRHYFAPGLHDAFGALWPLVVVGAVLRGACWRSSARPRPDRALDGRASPCSGWSPTCSRRSAPPGAEGAPVGFAINIRYVMPALLAALVLLPLPRVLDERAPPVGAARRACSSCSSSPTAPTRSSATPRASSACCWRVLVGPRPRGAALHARPRRAAVPRSPAGFAALAVVVVAIGYPVQRDYLRDRFRNDGPATSIPGMDLDSAYRWARGIDGRPHRPRRAPPPASSSTASTGPTSPTDVIYLGEKGPHGAFNAIPTCRAFRAAVNDRRSRLPGHLALPQLHPHRQPDLLARGGLAARRAGGDADRPQRPGHGLEGARPPRPGRLRPRQRAAAPHPQRPRT